MGISDIKKEIHDYIDHADDRFLRLIYSMVEHEQIEAGTNFFSNSADEMEKRNKASLKSITEGKTRKIKDFKKDVDSWKQHQAM
jgi:hypothetical protein